MKSRLSIALVAVSTIALGACSSSDASSSRVDAAVIAESIIIDVRTPEEYVAGHLDGATLIDIKDASFDAKMAELDPNASYIIYCRSGNRSAQAVERMKEAGFTNLTDLGSLENASEETGIAIVAG
ncbi:MAG: rhodanese-like domain-containing protein [Ilumatobacteraceae bacterium]